MDCKPWEAKTQTEFLSLAFQWNKWKSGVKEVWVPHRWRPGAGRWEEKGVHERAEVITWLYKLGRDYKVLDMDYEEFTAILGNRHRSYYAGKSFSGIREYSIRWRCSRWNLANYFTPQNYRRQRKFKQNGTRYEKKTKDEKKAEWWERKRFVLDRRRETARYRTSGWNRNWKYCTKRKHRRWERDMIRKERFDAFHSNSYKNADDRWHWD